MKMALAALAAFGFVNVAQAQDGRDYELPASAVMVSDYCLSQVTRVRCMMYLLAVTDAWASDQLRPDRLCLRHGDVQMILDDWPSWAHARRGQFSAVQTRATVAIELFIIERRGPCASRPPQPSARRTTP